MDDETHQKIGEIVQRAVALPDAPEELTPAERVRWLVQYLVENHQHPLELAQELKAILDACETEDEMFRALGAYTAKVVRSE